MNKLGELFRRARESNIKVDKFNDNFVNNIPPTESG